jgi:hypothetical protein
MVLSESYIKWVKDVRKEKRLHGIVEDKLVEILSILCSDCELIKEPQGLAGGRNDLMMFRFDGKKVLFEIFGSKSQVSRDLRILDKTSADKKIAVILDKEVDSGIIDKFLKENPESNYPYIFIGELFEKDEQLFIKFKNKLRYLVQGDEESWFKYLLHQKMYVSKKEFKEFVDSLKKLGFAPLSKEEIKTKQISVNKIFNQIVLRKLTSIGLKKDKLLFVLSWLSDDKNFPYLLRMLDHGMNVFLYIDFEGGVGFYSDVDLTDYLRIGYGLPEPQLLLSMNSIFHEIIEKFFTTKFAVNKYDSISYTIGYSEILKDKQGDIVTLGVPLGTSRIIVRLPIKSVGGEIQSPINAEACKEMIEFNEGKITVFRLNENKEGYANFFENIGK